MLQMNEERWLIADNLAADMVKRKTDLNEFGKVVAFLRHHRSKPNAKEMFTLMLQQLVENPNTPIRSEQTSGYYQQIRECCENHLSNISDPDELLLILGWCMRLMRYYDAKQERSFDEQYPQKPKQQPKPIPVQTLQPPKETKKPELKVGDKVKATILKKGAIDVTVRLQTDYNEEVVFERPYYPGKVGAQVKLKVLGINQNGQITKVVP